MFDSTERILGHYIKGITRFNIHFIEAYRSENPEAIFYLCQVKDVCYIVYETDYMDKFASILQEASEIFPDASFVRWLTKDKTDVEVTPNNLNDKQVRNALILSLDGTPMRYVTFEVKVSDMPTEHYNPNTYGAVSS